MPSRLRIQVLDFERAARGLSPDGIDPRELLAELEAQFIAEALGAPAARLSTTCFAEVDDAVTSRKGAEHAHCPSVSAATFTVAE